MRIDKKQMSETEDMNYTHSDLEIKEGSIPDSPVILLNSKWRNATQTRQLIAELDIPIRAAVNKVYQMLCKNLGVWGMMTQSTCKLL